MAKDAEALERRAKGLRRKMQREACEGLIAKYGEIAIQDLAMAARLSALDCLRFCRANGGTLKSVALDLGLSPRTLSNWALREREGRLHSGRPGRPKKEVSPEGGQAVVAFIRGADPTLGVGRLKRRFPNVSCAALKEMLRVERMARRTRIR